MAGAGLGNRAPAGYNVGRIQNFTPEQMSLFQQLFGHIGPESYLNKLSQGDEETFRQIETPAYRGFAALQGNLGSRFTGSGGQGSLGGRHSSGFQNTMSQAGANFLEDLQARRHDLKRQALNDLMGMGSNLLSQRPYENYLIPEQPSAWESFAGGLGSILGSASKFLPFFI